MRAGIKVALAAGIALASVPAAAQTQVNFDTLPNNSAVVSGTRITNQYASQGVTITLFEDGVEVGPGGLASNQFAISGGSNALYNTAGDVFPVTAANRADVLRISFTTGVSNVSFLSGGFGGLVTFQAYDSQGGLLETQLLPASINPNDDNVGTISFASTGIARIDGLQSAENFAFRIDDLSFTAAATPEPASWAMMVGGFGVIGGALRRRSRRRTFASA